MQMTHTFVMGLVSIFAVLSASADTTDHLFKLTPTTGGTPFVFGNAVGVSGTTGIVGSTGESTNGSFSGAAYLYNLTTGQELFTLHPNDGDDFDVFGFGVAIDGAVAIIGAPQNDDFGDNSGSAYLFDVATGQQQIKLIPNDSQFGDKFGFSVALDGGLAVIGAPEDSDNGNFSGSAYIFNAVTGQQLFKLLPADGQFSDNFGMSVAISGNTVIVGSWHDDDLGNGSGSAYLFDATTGLQITKITPVTERQEMSSPAS